MALHAPATSAFTPARPELITAVYEATAEGLAADTLTSSIARLAHERQLELSELAFHVLGVLRDAGRAAADDVRDAHDELQRLHKAEQLSRQQLAICQAHADSGGAEEIEAQLHVLAADVSMSRDELALAVRDQQQVLDTMAAVSSLAASALAHPQA